MKDKDRNKTKKQLLEDVARMRRRITKLEKSLEERLPAGFDLGILEHAIMSSISGIGITNMEGKLIFVNDAIVKMWGYQEKKEVLGRNLPEFWEGEETYEMLELIKEKGQMIGEGVGKRMDGSLFHVDYIGSLIRDRSGRPKYMFGSFVDNTKRKQVEEQLKKAYDELERKVEKRTLELIKAMDKLRSILDSSPDSITVTDADGVIVDCNQATLDNLGYASKQELIGKSPFETIAKKDHKRAIENLNRVSEIGSVHNVEYEIVRKDGSKFPASLSASVIKDASGEMRGFVAIAQDITQRKQAETALKESETMLREQKVALEQKNIALREIIAQIEIEKRKIKEDIATNASSVLLPILERFKTGDKTQKYVDLLKHHILGLTSSFGGKMKGIGTALTSREMEICNMIKGGLSNKDISQLLNISDQTVEGHRKKIRKKLGLTNKQINLTAYLRGL